MEMFSFFTYKFQVYFFLCKCDISSGNGFVQKWKNPMK